MVLNKLDAGNKPVSLTDDKYSCTSYNGRLTIQTKGL